MEVVLCGRADDVVVVAHCYCYYRMIVSVFASLVALVDILSCRGGCLSWSLFVSLS